MDKEWVYFVLSFTLIFGSIGTGMVLGLNYLVTGNPFDFQSANGPCGEGVRILHDGKGIQNIAVVLGDSSLGNTDSNGIFMMPYCYITRVSFTWNGTTYGVTLQRHQITEISI